MDNYPKGFRPMLQHEPGSEEERDANKFLTEFHESIGVMVQFFPAIEGMLFDVLGLLLMVPRKFALAVFTDVRIDKAMEAARRLIHVRKETSPNKAREERIERWLIYVFDQLALLNSVRNHLVHYGVIGSLGFDDNQNIVSSNRSRARTEAHVREIPISIELLKSIITDEGGVTLALSYIITALNFPQEFEKSGEAIERQMKETTWRYKPPAQENRRGKSQNKGQKQPHRPQSSPA